MKRKKGGPQNCDKKTTPGGKPRDYLKRKSFPNSQAGGLRDDRSLQASETAKFGGGATGKN